MTFLDFDTSLYIKVYNLYRKLKGKLIMKKIKKYKISIIITVIILSAVGTMDIQANILPKNVDTTQLLGKGKVNIIALSDIYSTASQVDENLMKKKSVVINVKGKKKDAQKYAGKLQNVIKIVNKQGVLFQYDIIKSKKNMQSL